VDELQSAQAAPVNARAARRSRTDWPTLALLLAMYVLFLGNIALYVYWRLPLLVHVAIGTLAIHLAFTIWHEAIHGTVSRKAWINDVVGVLGMFPYMTPYFMQRWVHLEHHAKLNHVDDPNYPYKDGRFITIPFRYPRALAYAKQLLKQDPRTRAQRISDMTGLAVIAGVHLVALWQGVLLEALLLWFVPVVIAKVIMDWYVNYLPHVGLPPDRFRGTRVIDVDWFTPFVLGHNYHAVHHLWPPVPWHRYRSVYRNKLSYFKSHGVPIEHAVFIDRYEPIRSERASTRAG
jgi:fatty acid desaturase